MAEFHNNFLMDCGNKTANLLQAPGDLNEPVCVNTGLLWFILFLAFFYYFWGQLTAHFVAHTIYSGVFARWYFRRDDDTPLLSSIKCGLFNSLGSCAFGGFVVAIVRAIQAVVEMAQKKMRERVILSSASSSAASTASSSASETCWSTSTS